MTSPQIKKITKDDEIGRIIKNEFINEFCNDFILAGPEETGMPVHYERFGESITNFEVRDSDIYLCTFPKSGSTWTQEMTWLIMNNLDYERAKREISERFPVLELCTFFDYENLENALGITLTENSHSSIDYIDKQKNPRLIKTHLPFSLLPQAIQNGSKSPKMIYLMRNPKDVCVSFFHHGRVLHGWNTNIENFAKVFMTNKIMYGPFWKHVFGFWERRNSLNILIITYEEMKKDLPAVIQKIVHFLDKKVTEEEIEKLSEHLSFESMKANKFVNCEDFINLRKYKKLLNEDGAFIRSGTVGKYKEELSAETIKKLDAWTKENIADTSFAEHYDYYL